MFSFISYSLYLQMITIQIIIHLLQTPVPITSYKGGTVIVMYEGLQKVVQIRYNWYTSPCDPPKGIMNCAVYAKAEMLPANGFFLDIVEAQSTEP
jgi:hypothetical protein